MSITSTQLQQQYIAYFGRPGDPEGLAYWTSDATDIKTAADFADKIYAQPEYQATTIASKTTSEQVNQLYVNLFNRSADPGGLLYWTTEIEKGTLSLSNLAYDLIYATENPLETNGPQAAQDAANLGAKVAAAEAYTATIASNSSALMAYQSGAAYESAVSFISSVSFNTQVNQPVITTAGGLAPLNTQAVNTFVGQMLGSQAAADAQAALADAATTTADAVAAAQTAQLQAAQLQAAQAEAAAAQATLANQQAIATAAADAAAAEEAAANAPQTLILKTTLDNLTGGSQDDLFNGAAGTIDSDILDGGDGNDTLKVTLAAGDNGATFQSSNIENLKFRTTAAASVDLGDVSGATGSITAERLANTANLTLTDVQAIPASIDIDRNSNNANITVTFDGTAIAGTTDTIGVNISNSSDAGTLTLTGVETINLVSTDDPVGTDTNDLRIANTPSTSGTAVLNISGAGDLDLTADSPTTINVSSEGKVELAPTLATTINHTGSGALTVEAANLTRTVTSTGTGALTFNAGTGIESVTGSSGNDRFAFAGNLVDGVAGVGDTVVGGDGTDTLAVTLQGGIDGAFTLVSGIETLETNSTGGGNYGIDLSFLEATNDITTINSVLGSNDTTLTLTDTQASTYGITGAATGTAAITQAGLNIDLLDSSATDDAITINLNSTQVNLANAFNATQVTADGIETITINADSVSTTTTAVADNVTVGTLNADALSTLTITGDADFAVTTALGNVDAPVDTVNASGATDAVTLVFNDSDITYTGGSGVDDIDFGVSLTSADSVDGGDGTDILRATFGSGTVTPTNISGIETFYAQFGGGALNASNLGDLTTLNIEAGASTVVSQIQATTTTINQIDNIGSPAVNFQYAPGSAATVNWTHVQTSAGAITNSATTFNNVATLTLDGDNGITGNSAITLNSVNGGSALTSLTIEASADLDEGVFNTGNLTGVNLETLNIISDAPVTLGTFASANELKTFSLTNVDKESTGQVIVGNIGATGAADELTSFTVVTQGDATGTGTEVHLGEVDAARATTGTSIDTFTIDLQGNYVTSTIGQVDANDIASINITTSTYGTSLTSGGFNLTGSITGDVNITAGDDFDGSTDVVQTNFKSPGNADTDEDDYIITEVSGSVGNVNLTSTGAMTIATTHAKDSFISNATTVGNIAFDTKLATSSINVGNIEEATTIGNITFTGLGSTTWDAAPAATTIGNISGSVAAGEQVIIGQGADVLGTTAGVIGSTVVTGGGEFRLITGPVTTLGNIDLTGMNASTSRSEISLSDTTSVGVIFDGSTGIDIFTGTGGADVINTGLGADEITTGSGSDNVNLTETVNSIDMVDSTASIVIADNSGNIDLITGFTLGASGDKIGIPIATLAGLEDAGNPSASQPTNSANITIAHTDAADFAFTAKSTDFTHAAGIAANTTGNILKITDVDTDDITDIDAVMTVNGTSAANDIYPIVWFDANGAGANGAGLIGSPYMEFGYNIGNADGNTTVVFASTTYIPVARVVMTASQYTNNLHVDNFDFINA